MRSPSVAQRAPALSVRRKAQTDFNLDRLGEEVQAGIRRDRNILTPLPRRAVRPPERFCNHVSGQGYREPQGIGDPKGT
jgi:hypothetical protein